MYNVDGAPDYWGTLQIQTHLSGKGGGGPLHLYPTLETNKQVKILFYGGEQIHSPGFFKHNIWYSVGAISLRFADHFTHKFVILKDSKRIFWSLSVSNSNFSGLKHIANIEFLTQTFKNSKQVLNFGLIINFIT